MEEEINDIIKILKKGGVILYPTDTVWGIGCDATNSNAVNKIKEIKKSNDQKSMLILINSVNNLYGYTDSVPDVAIDLINVVDSPMTIIYPKGKNVAPELLAEDGSIGIRVTKEEFSNKLTYKLKRPIVSTSANISGEKQPDIFKEITPYIINSVDYVVKYRQNDTKKHPASGIIKFFESGEFKLLRK